MKCDKCLYAEGEIKVFSCYNPRDMKYYNKSICSKCVLELVENYFDPTKSGSW